MTNNKQQTEINAVEYLDKVNQFAKENNTDKPRQQTAVEWLEMEIKKFNTVITREYMLSLCQQAKEMEKQQTRDDIKNELKLIGNYFDVGKLDQREQGHHIRFTSILKDRFDFYNETNGGNK